MDLGFETIGNATLICHDRGPVLVTDPWIDGSAYFGSWTFSHEIPQRQLDDILDCRFVWISHGHPDHLSGQSLKLLRDKKILLPDHVGVRIKQDLVEQGYDVTVLKDREWTELSGRIRVACVADYNQDGILLVDVGGKLVVNLNDASDYGWGRFVRKTVGEYKESFLLKLIGYGDADMINCYTEDGVFMTPLAGERPQLGKEIAYATEGLGATHFVPFSSMHKYQRADSVWADQYTTRLEDYTNGFESTRCDLLPAFISYDCAREVLDLIEPGERGAVALAPEEFGDDWSEQLEPDEAKQLTRYFKSFQHLEDHFDFIRFRVGGKEHSVDLAKGGFKRGVTFEAPRGSLMKSVEWEIFDDMLIGNFMKTTLHGDLPIRPLYPDFTPYVAKYGDNGRARSREELHEYFKTYRRRAPVDYLLRRLEYSSIDVFRSFISMDSPVYKAVRSVYRRAKTAGSGGLGWGR